MKRFTMTLLAAALPLAPRYALAQRVHIELPNPVMKMPGGMLPHSPIPAPVPLPNMPTRPFPIPTLPGPLPLNFQFLPNHGTVIPGVHLPEAGLPVRLNLAASKRGVKAQPIAGAAVVVNPRADDFQKTLSILRETFGLGEDGGLKTGARAENIAGAFDGGQVRGRTTIPEQELERDLGVK